MNTKQCKNCIYWISGGASRGPGQFMFCHHLLYTKKRRERDGDTCFSRVERKKKR